MGLGISVNTVMMICSVGMYGEHLICHHAVCGPERRDEAFWSLSEVLSGRYHDKMLTESGGTPYAFETLYTDFLTGVEVANPPSSSTRVPVATVKSESGVSFSSGLTVEVSCKAEPIPPGTRFVRVWFTMCWLNYPILKR